MSLLLYVLSTLPTTAPTFDEVAHLPAGLAQLEHPQAILNPEHPPLAKLIAAFPLWLSLPPLDQLVPNSAAYDEWRFGRTLLFERGLEPQTVLTLGRLPMVGLLLLLWLGMWQLAQLLYGRVEAEAALWLGMTCPLLLGHGRLVTTDVPLACCAVLTALALKHYLERLQTRAAVWVGLSLGCTLSVKFSGIVFVPAFVFVGLWTVARTPALLQRQPFSRWLMQLGWLGSCAVTVILLSYRQLDGLQRWWTGLQQVGFNHVPGYAFFLMGEYSPHGFAVYFPLAFLVKASWPVLTLLLYAGVCVLLRRRVREPSTREHPAGEESTVSEQRLEPGPFLWLPGGLYAFFVLLEAPQIGVRYLIPALPFLYVGLAPYAVDFVRRGGKSALAGLAVGAAFTLWQSWPDPLASFNGLGGCGGTQAYRCLDDSNLDWGQNLGRIQAALAPLEPLDTAPRLLYFGTASPRAYLERFAPMQAGELLHPLPAIYVVSSHRLSRLIEEVGRPVGVDWRQLYQPWGYIGNTYEIYDLRVVPPPNQAP